jgi:hypothetical protein
MRSIPLLPLILAAASAWIPCRAQVAQGLQAGITVPQGAFRDWGGSSPSFTLGYHQIQDLGEGSAFRPRFDVYQFRHRQELSVPGPSGYGKVSADLDNRVTMLTLGWEAVYSFLGLRQGPYAFGGIGLASTRLASTAQGSSPADSRWPFQGSRVERNNRFMYSMGLGWNWADSWGAEFRYLNTRAEQAGMSIRVDLLTAGVTYRFH